MTAPTDKKLDDLVRRLKKLATIPPFPEYEDQFDKQRRLYFTECLEAITALRAEIAQLRAVVAAADAMFNRMGLTEFEARQAFVAARAKLKDLT